ncbi:tyrosine-type recombinase/integrase [Pseudomonas sp. NPDC089758]|uniref:tyrosine-type recombinase/integrase n=1 Tax=Pseudomonas sp. NPDC089758 TaxID=3364473 RepID=UPI00382DF1B9
MGEFYRRPNFVCPDGAIRGVRVRDVRDDEEHVIKAARGLSWYHSSFPHPGARRHRFPIGDISLKKLYAAAESLGSYEVQQRNRIILSVYEHTGARRGEGASIMVADIIKALESGTISPLIRIITYKRGGPHERLVPVPRIYVQQWMDYIDTMRLLCVNEKNVIDDGHLFINTKTGKRLASTTVSNIIHDLRVAAGLDSRAHVHMFRHRFITNKLKMIMLQFDFENQDNFKRSLADFSGFREKLKQWTGHARIESLERYIHLACSELSEVGPAVDHALQAEAFRAIKVELDRIQERLDWGEITDRDYGELVQKTLLDGTGAIW